VYWCQKAVHRREIGGAVDTSDQLNQSMHCKRVRQKDNNGQRR